MRGGKEKRRNGATFLCQNATLQYNLSAMKHWHEFCDFMVTRQTFSCYYINKSLFYN